MSTYGVTRPQWVKLTKHVNSLWLHVAIWRGSPRPAFPGVDMWWPPLAARIWRGRHMATKTLEPHTATQPQISYIPICWHRRNRYCFRFIQSKWSLHWLSVETGNIDLTWPNQSCMYINLDRSDFGNNVHGVKRCPGFLLSKCYFRNEHDEWST